MQVDELQHKIHKGVHSNQGSFGAARILFSDATINDNSNISAIFHTKYVQLTLSQADGWKATQRCRT